MRSMTSANQVRDEYSRFVFRQNIILNETAVFNTQDRCRQYSIHM